jgi:hypothetical protein
VEAQHGGRSLLAPAEAILLAVALERSRGERKSRAGGSPAAKAIAALALMLYIIGI